MQCADEGADAAAAEPVDLEPVLAHRLERADVRVAASASAREDDAERPTDEAARDACDGRSASSAFQVMVRAGLELLDQRDESRGWKRLDDDEVGSHGSARRVFGSRRCKHHVPVGLP